MNEHGFPASQVLKLTGLTYRQLDYWATTDFIQPGTIIKAGQKTKRFYSFTDILAIRAAMRLLDAGIPLQRIRKAVSRLQSELPKKDALFSLVWLTDGENLFILEDKYSARDVLSGQYVFSFAVDIGQLANGLKDDIKILESFKQGRGASRRYKCPDLVKVAK